LTKYEFYYII